MKNPLFKDTFREIKKTKSKFFSIFAIVVLGVAFFAGIKATSPDMKITADKYFDKYRLMDMRLISTVGFTDEDVDIIKELSGAEGIMPSYSIDALVNMEDKDLVLNVLPLPMDRINNPDESYINRTKLVKGRYPKNSGEAVTEKSKMVDMGFSIGSKIKLSSGTDTDISENLKNDEFTIVGIVETPYYISTERGTTNIGNGKVDSFIMIPEENFKIPAYTDVFLTFEEARKAFSYDDEYDNILEPIRKKLDNTGKERSQRRYDEIISEGKEKIEDSKKELKEAEEKSNKELEEAYERIIEGEKEIFNGEKELANKEKEFYQRIKEAEAKISSGKKDLENGEREYKKSIETFSKYKEEAESGFVEGEQKIKDGQKTLDENEAKLNEIKTILETNPSMPEEQKIVLEEKYRKGKQELEYGRKELERAKLELENKKREFSSAENKLIAARKKLDDSKEQIVSEEKKLQEAKKKAETEFAAGHKKLDDSKRELEKGKIDYENGKKEVEEKLADARKKIEEEEEELKNIKDPTWYVIKRNQTLEFIDYGMAADRIDAIAQVFPVFFFLIAALVSLTTMTRMVDEQRTYIGTLKALGYGKFSIALKYILYAGLASVSGSIVGVLIGFKVFPTIIFNAYRIMYTMPPIVTTFNWYYAFISIAFAVLTTTLAALISCYRELKETPALLMRPKVQKSGKRIFLERIKFIWSRLNFSQKVTARNLIRYKKRLFMTVLGVGGCTALMLAGFGLKDSTVDIAIKQFDEIYQYDMVVGLKKGVESRKSVKLVDTMEKDEDITDFMLIKEQNIDVAVKNEKKNAFLVVPEDIDRLEDFIVLKSRINQEKVPLTNDGVILTEKLAKMLQVDIGDEISIIDEENKKINVKVNGIAENYVSHYVYMSPKLFEKVYGEKVKYKEFLANTKNSSEEFENKLSKRLLKSPEVTSTTFITGVSNSFKDTIGSLNYVVLVLIISAGALAFVVLYNLTNVNVSERLREIATIKVLGFYDNEVSAYVYRENTILTIIGIVVGLFMGVFLHRFIIVTGEIDYMMFARNIKPISYIYSAILTIIFAALVSFAMHFKLKDIKMVESLKSVE
ncbi:FtsX-like permease family protein [Anaerosalibacter bizertensis]|uniref:FtsX-like permease family protein n=1 Tax=Anaerosalibacter bizertensis TaxID=932217 RepID=A0A9Q4ACL4_9FIRM|nr:ABC transporter permease [Anaerosalibacter bizertensis]MBV1817518.1 FtsX-like permease family protein [Bacteroidales bacterium MSK.15.36]MCB5559462.1 FtsX-like permease family protein [Anaerosalibacter bizertensis]MCG4565068.1 FtsX-like permease family protein [Anaerosalibacter bizertensis]MCG4582914.1 FtsX-like permease family protein [Anaerosalibacter bizertensis]